MVRRLFGGHTSNIAAIGRSSQNRGPSQERSGILWKCPRKPAEVGLIATEWLIRLGEPTQPPQ
jgi:hypothetical protein